MGQEEIDRFLRRNKRKWFTSNQLAAALKVPKTCVNACLSRMRKYSEVKEKREKVKAKCRVGFHYREVPFYSFKER